jgi:hypothetical protein
LFEDGLSIVYKLLILKGRKKRREGDGRDFQVYR